MAPGFVQRPRPPLLLAAHGARTLAVAARYADTWNTFGPTLSEASAQSRQLDAACELIGRNPLEIRRSVLLGLFEGSAWTSARQYEERVMAWHAAGFRDFFFYDPPYARSHVERADPNVTEQLLCETLPRMRLSLA